MYVLKWYNSSIHKQMGHKSFEMEQEREQVYGNIVIIYVAFLAAQSIKNLPAMNQTLVQSLGWEDPLEKGVVTHSSILAWRIPVDRGAWRAAVHGVTESRVGHHRASNHSRAWDNLQILMLKKAKEETQIYLSTSCMLSLLHSESSRETGWGKNSKN